jgi:hypothetical protein
MRVRGAVFIALFILAVGPIQADTVSGILNATGLTVSLGPGWAIEFLPTNNPNGNFIVTVGSTGTFAPLITTTGQINGLTAVPGPSMAANFLTFKSATNLSFTLESVSPGIFGSADCNAAPAAGQTCTPPGTALNLTNTSLNNGTASFTVMGTASEGSGPASDFEGVIQATFSGTNYQALLANVANGVFSNSRDASGSFFVTFVPEPASVLLLGAGLLGVALLRRKLVR